MAKNTKQPRGQQTKETRVKPQAEVDTGKQYHPRAGADVKNLDELPDTFDFAKHRMPGRKCFSAEHIWFSARADEMEWRLETLRNKAAESKKLGSGKERAAAKRLQNMAARMADLRKELEAKGIDVDELIKVTA